MWKTYDSVPNGPVENGNENFNSELDLPLWSVVSFDKLEGSSLNYTAAYDLLEELESRKVAGLCLVTDEAASRFSRDGVE